MTTPAVPPLLEKLEKLECEPLETTVKKAIWEELLDQQNAPNANFCGTEAYWSHYSEECGAALLDRGRYCAARTHRDVLEAVALIKAAIPFEDIVSQLRQRYDGQGRQQPVSDEMLKGTTWLAARVLSMHQVGRARQRAGSPTSVQWEQGSLQACLSQFYTRTDADDQEMSFEQLFNVINLERLASIRVVWTSNLADHLRVRDLDGNSKQVSIFHHASYLHDLLDNSASDPFPDNFINETLQTLALLFPYGDRKVKQWFEKKVKSGQQVDRMVLLPSPSCNVVERHLTAFDFWRERLRILKETFDDAEPGTLKHWWIDDRRKVQWATFWVACLVLLLTIFFGFIQSIEGALQVYKAYNPS